MTTRQRRWTFQPGEKRDLGVSMASDLDAGASLTGNTPVVNAFADEDGDTPVAGFTITNAQVNASDQTADDGEVIAAGDGIFFRLTATTVRGTYYILSECDADDGTHPSRPDVLIVKGPAVQG